ncbi:DUF4961 domain-containing protein [Pedobacter arcticus]|uniref:DUF4961 domain-containing protein n=1 Tax=Pedobacter arcticus TaxID=752140 RepID=UPI00031FB290|nr:DUF4961 domain-containing protein [Pedobacter arcticus]
MKKLFKINTKKVFMLLSLSIVIFLAQCGLDALLITLPPPGNANEVSTFKLKISTVAKVEKPPYITKMVVGFLAPKSWKVASNTVVTFTSGKGDGTLELIPESDKELNTGLSWPEAAKKQFGIGPNLVNDLEWVVYRSTSTYSFETDKNTDINVTIKSKLGPENMLVKLGFFIGASREGINNGEMYKFAFSNAFEVKNGEGEVIDFFNPQLSKVDPVKSLDNDIITLTYDNGVSETVLSNTEEIYLCATALLDNGSSIEICEQTAKTKLKPIGGKRYIIDFWPRGFFNVPKGRSIVKLEYHFKDLSGIGKVGYGNTLVPFKYVFNCP